MSPEEPAAPGRLLYEKIVHARRKI